MSDAPKDMSNEALAALLEGDIIGSVAKAEGEFACDDEDHARYVREYEAVLEAARRLRTTQFTPGLAPAQRGAAVDALIALGWRAPGPPTEEEVERAARANIDPRTAPSDVERRRARAALTAALGGPE